MKKIYMPIVCAIILATNAFAQPGDAPTTPPVRNDADVITFYSESYPSAAKFTNLSTTGWSSGTFTTEVIAGNQVTKITGLNYVARESDQKDVSTMAFLHIDLWSASITGVRLSLNSSGGPGEKGKDLTLMAGWNSYEIPLSDFTTGAGAIPLDKVFQLKFDNANPGNADLYYDNIYFYRTLPPPTITGFAIPDKVASDAAFAITAPTSNSAGAFTYVSTNTGVATVSGNTITVVGLGTAVIIANQAANGAYGPGYAAGRFFVTATPPSTAPTTPPSRPTNNVISVYSEAYTNLSGIDLNPNWQQNTLVNEKTYASNTVVRLYNLNYQGLQLNAQVDMSNMQNVHIDIWTPDADEVAFSLITERPDGTAAEAVTDIIIPTKNGWNSFDIPLADFLAANSTINLAKVNTLKFESPAAGKTIYYDNLYFYTNAVLPVTLTSFDVKAENNGASLKWQTASESNNKGFSVERSLNGKDWVSLTFVAGNNNSTSVKNYAYTDKNPANGVNYYRLVQEDNDGKKTISDVKFTNFEISGAVKLISYPNPATDKLFVQLGVVKSNNAVVSLTDLQGKVKQSVNVNQSNSNTTLSLAVQGLPEGLYFLTIKDGADLQSSKVIVK
jgi:hypothetical protein